MASFQNKENTTSTTSSNRGGLRLTMQSSIHNEQNVHKTLHKQCIEGTWPLACSRRCQLT